MKKVIIDGKVYWQQEQSDIDRLPKQTFSKDMLTITESLDQGYTSQVRESQDQESKAQESPL